MADFTTHKIAAGQKPWYPLYWAFVDVLQGFCTEIESGRGAYPSLSAAISAKLDINGGLNTNLNCNNHRLTSVGDPLNSQDVATMAYVHAVVTAGGSPSAIPATSLNKGTMVNGTYLRADPVTGALYGYDPQITDFGVGTLGVGQIPINSGGVMTGYTPPATNYGLMHFMGGL